MGEGERGRGERGVEGEEKREKLKEEDEAAAVSIGWVEDGARGCQ